ncbi:OmpA family protein [Leeuwenhoekiella palythoae]|uniref:Outer membrane protein OmpA n=1 Tax=Leeuwenhoekiella palythoae TaxID=573501 RepID=A0A1M5Y354_9FLAO|nr:OmpA family protein [Leeuwenhoekiella palythoae]RXG30437.1 outer membrane protein OmpA-like peptidoglycan-associated protein [Leeuwenhoekiella palythoae]SHI06369.1 Outer membrane protein OmpA [Leeuwenhoekiella palythoae]
MKNYTLLIILLAVCQVGFTQNQSIEKANKLFASQAYAEAIALYSAADQLDSDAALNLADALYYNANAEEAVKAYAKAWELNPGRSMDAHFRYADALKRSNAYDKANEILTTYSGTSIDILKAMEKNDMEVSQFFMPEVMDAASAYADFAPAYYDRQLVFASDRNAARPTYPWTGKPFLDLYYAQPVADTLSEYQTFSRSINTDTHESNAVFFANGTKMYFTRTSNKFKKIDGAKVAPLQLYSAELVNGKWGNIELLSISSDSYSVAHPALSADEQTLYFSSDMPGGYGSFDIYKVSINGNNTFGTPVNLGENVNSDKLEQFPYVSENGNLYFASNRVEGLGGLDLYSSDASGDAFAEAYNLGSSINSNADDFSLIIKERQASGYMSSNRTGKDKIYQFTTFPNLDYQIIGNVDDKKTLEPIEGAEVTLYRPETGSTQKMTTLADGSFKFEVHPNSTYKVKASKALYAPVEKEIKIEYAQNTKTLIKLQMSAYADSEEIVTVNDRNQLTQVNLEKIYFDFDKANIRPDAAVTLDKLVQLMKKYPEMDIEVASHTDQRGSDSYNLALSQRRAQSTVDYVVSKGIDRNRLKAKGYGETDPIHACPSGDCTEAQFDENRRSEFTLLK